MKEHVLSFKFISVVAQLSLILVLLVSCNQEEAIYSCNPEIDSWAKKNKQSINAMSVDEFLSLERDYQKASYIAFSPKQRENLWISKITEVTRLDWSEDEEIKEGKNKMTNRVKTRSEDGGDGRNCNSNSNSGEGVFLDDCAGDSHCVGGYWNCKPKWAGCGLFYLDSCDGYCW